MSANSVGGPPLFRMILVAGALLSASVGAQLLRAGEPITLTWEAMAGEPERTVLGEAVLSDQQGGVLLLDRGGRYWSVPGSQVRKREAAAETFQPLKAKELSAELQREFGDKFAVIETPHYVICTDAGERFGTWTGKLFERLLTGFYAAWKDEGLELTEPAFPLPVVIFAEEAAYREYARRDVGAIAVDLGYYSSQTNRIALRDLTPPGAKGKRGGEDLSTLVNAANVTTIVHEAAHQIAFNSGFHVRLADNPMWLTEGLAMYFESPDLKNAAGWKTTGQINRARLQQFRDYSRNRRKAGSLETLLADNARFTKADTAGDAYAEAWLLTHFLIRQHGDEYAAYIRSLQTQTPLDIGPPEKRLAAFRAAFGDDLGRLEKAFLGYAARLPR